MNFLHRFKYFAFGLLLGSLIVYTLLFRNRDSLPAWTPNDRVLQELRLADTILIDPSVELPFPDSLLLQRVAKSSVRFGESDVRSGSCRVYQLDSKEDRMRFSICKDTVTLVGYASK